MPRTSRPRKGSLQFWPRKRAAKILPSVNWKPVHGKGILGFITYKAGMASALVKDLTEKSLTSKKQITFPVTILEAPNMKIFSLRFYNQGKVIKDVIVSNDKELKSKFKVPKTLKDLNKEIPQNYDDIRLMVYSLPKQAKLKKSPDVIEIVINADNKLEFIKPFIGKANSLADFLKPEIPLLDVRGLTKGKGFQGPVKRFGISLKAHKSEKGVRRPGSLAPWHPARVTFHAPMAGQLGFFSRVHYNLKLISSGSIKELNINPKSGFKNYGNINTSFIILKGSDQGPAKRPILITPSFRPTKSQSKLKYEFLELV